MSKYTTQVRFICETSAGLTDSGGFGDINEIIRKAIPKVFNFDFPVYDENYRNVLCTKILKHYYTREIGAETVGLWKLWLDTRLNEIMPYYNQLYKSAMIEFNPMYDIDLTTTHSRENGGTTDVNDTVTGVDEITGKRIVNESKESDRQGSDKVIKDNTMTDSGSGTSKEKIVGSGTTEENVSGNNSGSNTDAFSETPQGALDNVMNLTYLTNARRVTNEGQGESESNKTFSDNRTSDIENTTSRTVKDNGTDTRTITDKITDNRENTDTTENTANRNTTTIGKTTVSTTEEYLQTIKGKSSGASYSKRLQEFRSTFLNIDAMIIDELKDLFFNLW